MFPFTPTSGLVSAEFMQGFHLGLSVRQTTAGQPSASPNPNPLLVGAEEACKFLGVKKTTFFAMLKHAEKAGTLHHFRVEVTPGFYRYSVAGLSLVALNLISCIDNQNDKEGLCR
jgi:hypothetical protein